MSVGQVNGDKKQRFDDGEKVVSGFFFIFIKSPRPGSQTSVLLSAYYFHSAKKEFESFTGTHTVFNFQKVNKVTPWPSSRRKHQTLNLELSFMKLNLFMSFFSFFRVFFEKPLKNFHSVHLFFLVLIKVYQRFSQIFTKTHKGKLCSSKLPIKLQLPKIPRKIIIRKSEKSDTQRWVPHLKIDQLA